MMAAVPIVLTVAPKIFLMPRPDDILVKNGAWYAREWSRQSDCRVLDAFLAPFGKIVAPQPGASDADFRSQALPIVHQSTWQVRRSLPTYLEGSSDERHQGSLPANLAGGLAAHRILAPDEREIPQCNGHTVGRVDVSQGTTHILGELRAFGVDTSTVVISSDLRMRGDGQP
jgi:hypothetical protein